MLAKIKRQSKRAYFLLNSHLQRLKGKKVIHFLHISKTGGTAIKEAIRSIGADRSQTVILHNHQFSLKDVPRGDKVFFIIRDPLTRFVSGFNSRLHRGRPRYDVPWAKEERKAFSEFETPNQLAVELSSDMPAKRLTAREAMEGISHISWRLEHWLISADYLMSRRKDIIHIGFIESLEKDFEAVKEKLNLPDQVELPTDPIRSHKSPQDLDTFLSEEAKENLRSWYEKDFEILKACRIIARENI